MRRLFVNIVIFVVAILLLGTVGVFGFVWSFLSSLFQIRKTNFFIYWGDVLYAINVGIDKIGNVLLGSFLNTTALHNKYKVQPFGTVHFTISQVLALNERENNITGFGKWIIDILELLDPGHMDKSIDRL